MITSFQLFVINILYEFLMSILNSTSAALHILFDSITPMMNGEEY
jgi:hypothetical protein